MGALTPPRPLRAEDDRDGFDCGRDSLNQWLRRHAWHNHAAGLTRTTVLGVAGSSSLAAFVSLSMGQIERAALPKPAQRNRPTPIPIVLLGQLAVDLKFQGQGCAQSMLAFGLRTAVRVSRDVGCFGVALHPLDERLRGFYRRFGFEDLPFDPKRAMFVSIADLERNGFGG